MSAASHKTPWLSSCVLMGFCPLNLHLPLCPKHVCTSSTLLSSEFKVSELPYLLILYGPLFPLMLKFSKFSPATYWSLTSSFTLSCDVSLSLYFIHCPQEAGSLYIHSVATIDRFTCASCKWMYKILWLGPLPLLCYQSPIQCLAQCLCNQKL